jgi:hypothetical protein
MANMVGRLHVIACALPANFISGDDFCSKDLRNSKF